MNAIEIRQLSFSYGRQHTVLNNINLSIPKGSIYGFLGPNGVGKTTTLKLILSLLNSPDIGTIKVLDKYIKQNYPSYLNNIGSLIENASIYDHLNARENLKIWSNYHGIQNDRIDQILQLIDLGKTRTKKVKNYSTGMRQRLGLGVAMLHDPEILILDEPTNGLDPIGINSLRSLLNRLKEQGKTVLLSSHILSEVERIVDHVGIINQGKIVFEGTLDSLKSLTMTRKAVTIRTDQPIRTFEALRNLYECNFENNELHLIITNDHDINRIAMQLIQNDIQIEQIIQPQMDLEQIFMKITNKQSLQS